MTKANGRKPLNIELSEDERVLLDGIRARLGLRSLGEAVRALISNAVAGEVPPGFEQVPLPDVRSKAPMPPTAAPSGVQVGPRTYKPGDLAKKGKR